MVVFCEEEMSEYLLFINVDELIVLYMLVFFNVLSSKYILNWHWIIETYTRAKKCETTTLHHEINVDIVSKT